VSRNGIQTFRSFRSALTVPGGRLAKRARRGDPPGRPYFFHTLKGEGVENGPERPLDWPPSTLPRAGFDTTSGLFRESATVDLGTSFLAIRGPFAALPPHQAVLPCSRTATSRRLQAFGRFSRYGWPGKTKSICSGELLGIRAEARRYAVYGEFPRWVVTKVMITTRGASSGESGSGQQRCMSGAPFSILPRGVGGGNPRESARL